MVAANSPMLAVPDPSASGGDIKQNKFSRKSIGSSPTKQSSPEGHVPNGKDSGMCSRATVLLECLS